MRAERNLWKKKTKKKEEEKQEMFGRKNRTSKRTKALGFVVAKTMCDLSHFIEVFKINLYSKNDLNGRLNFSHSLLNGPNGELKLCYSN